MLVVGTAVFLQLVQILGRFAVDGADAGFPGGGVGADKDAEDMGLVRQDGVGAAPHNDAAALGGQVADDLHLLQKDKSSPGSF